MADLIKTASVNCQGIHQKLNHLLKRSEDINVYSIHKGQTQEVFVSFLTISLNLKYTM